VRRVYAAEEVRIAALTLEGPEPTDGEEHGLRGDDGLIHGVLLVR